jgi:hypothetical protein
LYSVSAAGSEVIVCRGIKALRPPFTIDVGRAGIARQFAVRRENFRFPQAGSPQFGGVKRRGGIDRGAARTLLGELDVRGVTRT